MILPYSQVTEIIPASKPSPSPVVARPVKKAPTAVFHGLKTPPEVIPVEVDLTEESGDELSSALVSEDKCTHTQRNIQTLALITNDFNGLVIYI
jgi:hypothetical protein